MKLLKKLFHPLIALIAIQLIWVLLVVFWIYWFIGSHKAFRKLAELYKPEVAGYAIEWPVLVEGLALLLLVLAGVYVIFLYWKRQSDLVNQQKSFMSQVTHELKSPLASIQLHLETIKLRNPPPDKMERFLDTMLADTDRLEQSDQQSASCGQAREHRVRCRPIPGHRFFPDGDEESWNRNRAKLPEGGSITIEVEEGIKGGHR